MCTREEAYEEATRAVNDTLFTPDPQGHTRFAREVHDAVFDESNGKDSKLAREMTKVFYQLFGRWFFFGGAAVLVALGGLYYQIQDHEEILSEGGRYTENDAIEDRRLQEGRDSRQDEDIQELRTDTNEQFRNINEKLDTLINRLIP